MPGTMERIAGHIQTGGPIEAIAVGRPAIVEAMKVLSRDAPAADDTAVSALRAAWSIHHRAVISLAIVAAVIVGAIAGVRWFIDAAGRPSERRPVVSGGAQHDDADRAALQTAREAEEAGRWSDMEAAASVPIESNASAGRVATGLLLRGRARLHQDKALAAVEDLTRVIDGFPDQDAYAAALLLRGQAHARANDPARAIADLGRAVSERKDQAITAEARLERGLLLMQAGKTDEARADLTWAADYTPNHSDVHRRALEARSQLPGGAR